MKIEMYFLLILDYDGHQLFWEEAQKYLGAKTADESTGLFYWVI